MLKRYIVLVGSMYVSKSFLSETRGEIVFFFKDHWEAISYTILVQKQTKQKDEMTKCLFFDVQKPTCRPCSCICSTHATSIRVTCESYFGHFRHSSHDTTSSAAITRPLSGDFREMPSAAQTFPFTSLNRLVWESISLTKLISQ